MALTFYFHPLSSYCHKALIALYENATPFVAKVVNLQDPAESEAFRKLWPVRKFPLLHDADRDRTIPESSIIIEYLDQYYPGRTRFIPSDPDVARETRLQDRFFDLYIHQPMQQAVGDRLRPAESRDPFGVNEAKTRLRSSYDIADQHLAGRAWAMGDEFTMADCAAAPALFFADKVVPFAGTHRNLAAYFARLQQRPSYARVLKEAQPFMQHFPKE
jgi:glutathione S-transferase